MGDAGPPQMPQKGAVSYKNDNVNLVLLGGPADLAVARVNVNVARIFFVARGTQQEMPVPAGVSVEQSDGQRINEFPPGSFLITWTGDFVVKRDGAPIVKLTRQIQQSIGTLLATECIERPA